MCWTKHQWQALIDSHHLPLTILDIGYEVRWGDHEQHQVEQLILQFTNTQRYAHTACAVTFTEAERLAVLLRVINA